MNVSGRNTATAGIHGIHEGQEVAQFRVTDETRHKFIGGQREGFGMRLQMIAALAQMKKVYLVGQTIDGLNIGFYALGLMRKMPAEIFRESLASIGQTIGGVRSPISDLRKQVIGLQEKFITYAEIATDFVERTALVETAERVHAGLEGESATPEGLQTASCRGIFLQDRHDIPLVRENGGSKQAAKSSANDNHLFICSIHCK